MRLLVRPVKKLAVYHLSQMEKSRFIAACVLKKTNKVSQEWPTARVIIKNHHHGQNHTSKILKS